MRSILWRWDGLAISSSALKGIKNISMSIAGVRKSKPITSKAKKRYKLFDVDYKRIQEQLSNRGDF